MSTSVIEGMMPLSKVERTSKMVIGAEKGENKLSTDPIIARLYDRSKYLMAFDALTLAEKDEMLFEDALRAISGKFVEEGGGVESARAPVILAFWRLNVHKEEIEL